MVGVFFYAKSHFQLTQVNEPISILGVLSIGGPVSIAAGVLLIGLGIREYTHGHSHDHEEHGDTQSGHHDHTMSPTQEQSSDGLVARVKNRLGGIGGHSHEHGTGPSDETDRGLFGIAWLAFVLGLPTRRSSKLSGSVPARRTVWN